MIEIENRIKDCFIATPEEGAVEYSEGKMSDQGTYVFVGWIIGLVAASCIWVIATLPAIRYQNEILTKCEQSLPRTQTCVLTAVPKEIK